MIYRDAKIKIYFGGVQDDIDKLADAIPREAPLVADAKFNRISELLAAEHLAFLNQTHSDHGLIVKDRIPAFDHDGDFLIAAKNKIGIGILSADCLPIAMYDPKNHVAAIVHAGWKGSLAGVAQNAMKAMQQEFGTQANDLQVFFGPSANVECYQVSADFSNNLTGCSYSNQVFKKIGDSHYFDLPLFNALQLQMAGVPEDAISREYNFCTMCDDRFFSSRRLNGIPSRQATIVDLA